MFRVARVIDFAFRNRDNENAYVSLNGKQCWTRKFGATQGSQVCGQSHTGWNEVLATVNCQGAAVNGKLAVRVWTSLNSGANDESFGIAKVVVQKLATSETDKFDGTNFRGWNCGKIQKCGKFGNICGGFGVKGTGSDIKKTFTVPAGTYTVKLDFIKIDSWYGWSMLYTGACKVRVTRACLVSSTYRMFANIAATLPQGQRESIRQFERQNMLDPEL